MKAVNTPEYQELHKQLLVNSELVSVAANALIVAATFNAGTLYGALAVGDEQHDKYAQAEASYITWLTEAVDAMNKSAIEMLRLTQTVGDTSKMIPEEDNAKE